MDAATEAKLRRILTHKVPLGFPDDWAVLLLPADLTEAEAERICGVIRSLALPS